MKICVSCDEKKKESAFSFRNKSKNIRHGTCKYCISVKNKRHYLSSEKRRNSIRSTRKKLLSRNRKFILDYLLKHPCVDCGYSDTRVLDFDHRNSNKVENVSFMVKQGWGLKRIKDEIDKCDVRCSNCHRIATQERGYYNVKVA